MISAIIAAAGNGSRFGREKLLELIEGEPLIIRTVEQFYKAKNIDEIIVVASKKNYKIFQDYFKKNNLKVKLVKGGTTRYISAYNGVKASKGEFSVIHDGARPLVPTWLIDNVCEEVKKHYAVMTAIETYTCVKQSEDFSCIRESLDLFVQDNLPRAKAWLGQTPHAFKKEIILEAYKKAIKKKSNGMDDCELVSESGVKVKIVPGDQINIKVTYPTDLIIARCFYKEAQNGKL